MIWIIAGFGAVVVTAYIAYHVGYVRGYSAGMAYGMDKLEDYHQHTIKNMQSLK
jgi:hypothetical protein